MTLQELKKKILIVLKPKQSSKLKGGGGNVGSGDPQGG